VEWREKNRVKSIDQELEENASKHAVKLHLTLFDKKGHYFVMFLPLGEIQGCFAILCVTGDKSATHLYKQLSKK
jgi:hypothetical protein